MGKLPTFEKRCETPAGTVERTQKNICSNLLTNSWMIICPWSTNCIAHLLNHTLFPFCNTPFDFFDFTCLKLMWMISNCKTDYCAAVSYCGWWGCLAEIAERCLFILPVDLSVFVTARVWIIWTHHIPPTIFDSYLNVWFVFSVSPFSLLFSLRDISWAQSSDTGVPGSIAHCSSIHRIS